MFETMATSYVHKLKHYVSIVLFDKISKHEFFAFRGPIMGYLYSFEIQVYVLNCKNK